MGVRHTGVPARKKPLRLWPGVALVVLQWLAWFGATLLGSEAAALGAMGALLVGPAIILWWLFFSRAPRFERWGAVALMILAVAATPPLLHESIRTGGMGFLFYLYVVPVLSLAFVVWAVATRRLSGGARRLALVATVLLACGAWTLLRTAGITGEGHSDFTWRWAETAEEKLLAQAGNEPTPLSPALAAMEMEVHWPGFRGPHRDDIVSGVRIKTDWKTSPPVELWRRPVGPGWSSFAVGGDLLFTQEQLGDDEVVSGYHAATGELVWRHRDAARFWESNAGAGPRATPALAEGRVYTLGATGILNALDARNGKVVWSRNAVSDTGGRIPGWGFASSPLVVDDLLIVHAGGLIAYDLATGEPRWSGPAAGSYSSPHEVTLGGVAQIVMLNGTGATGVAPDDGRLLWEHPWAGSIVQPALTADGDLLISAGEMLGPVGLRRIAVADGSGGWTVQERWTSARLKPNFSDFVVHEGHAFGFDGTILACIDVEKGERRWKGGRYGSGQLLLLRDQNLLLVLSEKGDLVLVEAVPGQFAELARFPAIEGKTWNHPVLVGDLLLVRNGQEMAAFRLSLAG